MPRIILDRRRSRTSCSLIALATVMVVGASPAAAQSFLGSGTYVANPIAGGITTPDTSTTNIALNSGNTIIEWTPADNASGTGTNILFQPVNTTANFNGSGDFAVLNRIMVNDATRAIVMNGTVNARVGEVQGGSVYFYAPGGFIFGGTSTFSVGSLVVSALPISNAEFTANAGGNLTFGQAVNPNAFISSSGTIDASQSNSYVAMVAPRIQHSGSITVDGSAALVAAEAATINFSPDGLFDIQVSVGTGNSEGINVTGDITGPTPTSSEDKQGIYLVAVPKNDALTMVIGNGADLGFTLANTAVDDNGTIVLSAGHDIVDGEIGSKSEGHGEDAAANFWFTGAHATNNLFGEATGYADLYSISPEQPTTVFDNDVTVHANQHVWMNASGEGATLRVRGDLSLSTDQFATESGGSATGGQTALYALNGGQVTVDGNASLSANGFGGGTESSGEAGGTGTGGSILVHGADGGSLHVVGDLTVTADGFGGDSFDGNGGAGIGGKFNSGGGVTIAANGGTLTVDGALSASAGGFGGEAFQSGTTSGNGTGGNVSLQANSSGNASIGEGTTIHADGLGGTVWDTGANGGDGQGGTVTISAAGTGSTLSLTGALVSANGEGGGPGEGSCCVAIGGDGTGGYVNLFGSGGGLIESEGTLEFSAAGRGGYGGTIGGNGFGGSGANGGVFVQVQPGLTLDVTGDLALDATGSGGDGETTGGNGTGGAARLHVTGGTAHVTGELNVDADSFGGDGVDGGDAGNGIAGATTFAEVLLTGSSSLLTVDGRLLVEADGTGGSGSNREGPLGDGGGGTAGRAGIYGNGGTIDAFGGVEVVATGSGGEGATGGAGTGKLAQLAATGGTINIDGQALVSASGFGGDGLIGGDGIGGGEFDLNFDGAHLFAQNGTIDIDGSAIVVASGTGGSGFDGGFELAGGVGGDGFGGYATIHAANSDSGPSSVAINGVETSATVISDGRGGDGGDGGSGNNGGNGGAGGNGDGGFSGITAAAGNGTVTIDFANLSSQGVGGDGGSGGNGDGGPGGNGGAGGSGVGGQINVGTESGDPLQAELLTDGEGNYGGIVADATGWGGQGGDGNFGSTDGSGGDGGSAEGGASVLLIRGSTVNAGSVFLVSQAVGGDGGLGGGETGASGNGGSATIGGEGGVGVLATQRFQVGSRGTLNAGSINAVSTAEGGQGAATGASNSLGGNLFWIEDTDATLGTVTFTIDADTLLPAATNDSIAVIDGVVNGDVEFQPGSFQFTTPNSLSLYVDNGSMRVDGLLLIASDFVTAPGLPAPANRGTLFANSASITTGNDFVADANFDIANTFIVDAPGSIRVGSVHDDDGIDFTAGGTMSIDGINAGSFLSLLAGGSIDTDDITAGTSVDITSDTGSIGVGNIGAGSAVNLSAGDLVLANGGSITTGDIEASSVDMTSAGGNIATGDIFAFGDVQMDAFGDILSEDITAGTIDLAAGDDITTDNLMTQFLLSLAEGDGITTQLFEGASITLESDGDITTDNIDSIDGVYANAGGSISAGSIDAVDWVDLNANGNISTGAITAGEYIYAETDGNISTGALTAGLDVNFENGGNISFTSASVGTEFDFESDGSVTGGNIVAGATIEGEAGGSVTLGNLTAGFDPGEFIDDDTFSVGIQAEGSITVGNVAGAERVGFATLANLTTGSIQAGQDFLAFADGNITTGGITTDDEGQVYLSGTDVFLEAGGGEDSDFDPEAALALTPAATGGSITINGPVNTGMFRAAAGTGLTTQAIDAGSIQASAGGTATLNGLWSGEQIELTSNDIDITATGGVDAGTNGEIFLFSSNPAQMLIGDGLTGTGYALSNAEFGRLSGGDVTIVGRADASAVIDMLIGDLAVTGPSAGSTIEDSEGVLAFAAGDVESQDASGVIRVAGDVNATGFGSSNAIEFYADRFELDAATGSIAIVSSGSTLSGEIGLYADRIHVAAGSILDQLAANPTYAGYQDDLNEPAAVQRPEGVLRADTLWIESDNLQDILIQNTGSSQTPAGFLVRQAFVNDDEDVAGPPGSINLIVNGQVVTDGGTLTGVDARDALITDETDITPFTSNSTINNCPLTGACGFEPPPSVNVVDDTIDLITNDPLGDGEFGNEPDIDDNEEGDEGSNNPISPPQPLFDTRPLIPGGDVNDPVSGTGNPALLGGDQCGGDDQEQCPAKGDSQ